MTRRPNSTARRATLALLVAAGALALHGAAATAQISGPAWVDAALHLEDRAKTYFFQGSRYYRLTGNEVDAGYPQALPGGWKGLPEAFHAGIDAALYYPPTGKSYLFKGGQYVRLTGVEVEADYPRQLPGGWLGLPAEFARGIDAAIFRDGHTYFFKGNQYVRFTGYTMDDGYPQALPGGWALPREFAFNLGAALNLPDQKNYFFRGNRYVRLTDTSLDAGYPRDLPGAWAGLLAVDSRSLTQTPKKEVQR